MDFAEREGARVIVRGLRAVADFEYEYQMAGMNQQINPRVETGVPDGGRVAAADREPAGEGDRAVYGGPIDRFVSPTVAADVAARVEKIGRKGS